MTSIKKFRRHVERLQGRREQIQSDIAKTKKQKMHIRRTARQHEQAREIIREVGLKTQQELQYHISDITSMALEAVFPEPYDLVVEFVERRNKTECDLYFQRNGNKTDPLSAAGGGAVDVASFALRVASWSMQSPHSRPVLILDEPFRYLSTGLQPKASEMLKEISEQLGLQIIMVTHEEELLTDADKTFQVSMNGNTSTVEEA
jgi:DNA repair exonuclease SbcCD ATPase subunit